MDVKSKSYKSGFRAPEGAKFDHQLSFFYRFLEKYPNAIEELRELLPLLESVFGKSTQMTDKNYWRITRFDSQFLVAPEELLSLVNIRSHEYQSDLHRRNLSVPDFVQMPDDHEYKCNEFYYKGMLETSLLWKFTELHSETENNWLQKITTEQREIVDRLEKEVEREVYDYCKEKRIEATESELIGIIYKLVEDRLNKVKLFENEDVDKLLDDYWSFYEKFHDWLEKYSLQKDWLRKSFFLSLREGLSEIKPDIGIYYINLPEELNTELYGEDQAYSFHRNQIPVPKKFCFELIYLKSKKLGEENSKLEWQPKEFSIFSTPDKYEEEAVIQLEDYLSNYQLFEAEEHIINGFSVFADGFMTDISADQREVVKKDFRNHIWSFPYFKEAVEQRSKVIEQFRLHIRKYLEWVLPLLGRYYKTREGRRHNFAAIDWLLSWNVDQLTAPEILREYKLPGEENSVRKKFKLFSEKYNLPVRAKRNRAVYWRDKSLMSLLNQPVIPRKNSYRKPLKKT